MRPLAIDLFAGLFGWSEGLVAEGFRVIGFDLEDMHGAFGLERPEHFQLVIQDVLTLHGSQFKDAALIVASPPCQAYSYRAMPWKKAKALPPPDNTLFDACFRIQREACEAAGRHIPLVVENVRGAQPWVGRARWNFGSFYLWGDVPALMPPTSKFGHGPGVKRAGRTFCFPEGSANPDAVRGRTGKQHWADDGQKNPGFRKMASAMIAKIPKPLAQWVAKCHYPQTALPSVSPAISSIAQMNAGCGPERLIGMAMGALE